jgi:hypothetical protein
MKRVLMFFLLVIVYSCNNNKSQLMETDFKIGFESNTNTTPTYHEVISFYEKLCDAYGVKILKEGETDAGYPLHTIILDSNPMKEKPVVLINNGIHPGEPCGIDASMMLVRDLIIEDRFKEIRQNLKIVVIPFYNIGGGLNRSATSRANQDGPEAYGFRGNAKNLDLNRDFVKCDSKNAITFNQIFNKHKPHLFIDTHTSNGADYQYVMTLIPTQKDKLAPALSKVLTTSMLPFMYNEMEKKGFGMTPYVYAQGSPDNGIYGFLDLGRYSSGYAALHHCISFMPETHMLKPYKERVLSTYDFLEVSLHYANLNGQQLIIAKEQAIIEYQKQAEISINWTLDKTKEEKLLFKGYEAKYKTSEVTGVDRLYYNREAPYEKEVPFFNSYKSSQTIRKPKKYIIPKAYSEVIERLEMNGVIIEKLEKDTLIRANFYRIKEFKDQKAYEGHYLHYGTELTDEIENVQFYKGDYVVDTDQSSVRYIIETLEPQAPDSYFSWNFFDGILMQKEHYSDYVFEDLAAELLQKDKKLAVDFKLKKESNADFAGDPNAQLEYIYEQSPYYERTYRRYPIARVY